MSRRHHPMRGNARRAAFALALALVGCGEYAATNPYDSRFVDTLRLSGPDTTHSIDQVLTFTLTASPAWPDAEPVWSSSDTSLVPTGGGNFLVHSASYSDRYVTVTATLGSKAVSHQLRVRQRTNDVVLTGGTPHTSFDSSFATAYGAVMPFGASMHDSHGFQIGAPWPNSPSALRLIVRDTTVAHFASDSTLRAGVTGRTYVVGEADGRRDSMVVRVRQLPASATTSPTPIALNPGDSVQVTVTSWADAGGHAIAEAMLVSGYGTVSAFGNTAAVTTVTADGWVHADSVPGLQGIDVLQVHWATADGLFSGWVSGATIWVGMAPGSYP